jgi:Xaa-Pro dipeptidase
MTDRPAGEQGPSGAVADHPEPRGVPSSATGQTASGATPVPPTGTTAIPGRLLGAGEGTVALGATPRVDTTRLRTERRTRLLAAMADAHLDVLLLGREPNARYVSGARRLWTSGTRPFGPGCVVVAETGGVHLLTTWEDGLPPEVPFDACYGLSWDGARLVRAVAGLPGVGEARRVGVDGWGPGTERLVGAVAPRATVVDATTLLQAVRARKTIDELACLRSAVAAAESAAMAAATSLEPGATGRSVAGRFVRRLGALGLTVADGPATVGVGGPAGPPGPGPDAGVLPDGALVAVAGTASLDGYRGDAAWTWRHRAGGDPEDPPPRLLDRWHRLRDALVAAVVPGVPADALLGVWEEVGEPVPPMVLAHGVGLGMEPPVLCPGLTGAPDTGLAEGSVVALWGYLADDTGGLLATVVVEVAAGGARPLSRLDGLPWGAA